MQCRIASTVNAYPSCNLQNTFQALAPKELEHLGRELSSDFQSDKAALVPLSYSR